MLNDEKLAQETNQNLPANISNNSLVDTSSLKDSETEILKNVITAASKTDLQQQLDLFNMNQSKKNAVRISKLNNILDKVDDQLIERISKRPDQIDNKTLIEVMNAVSNQIERMGNSNKTIVDPNANAIKLVNTENSVNIHVGKELTKAEKQNAMAAVNAILRQVRKQQENILPDETMEVSDYEDKTMKEENN